MSFSNKYKVPKIKEINTEHNWYHFLLLVMHKMCLIITDIIHSMKYTDSTVSCMLSLLPSA